VSLRAYQGVHDDLQGFEVFEDVFVPDAKHAET